MTDAADGYQPRRWRNLGDAIDWDSDPDPVATFARIDQACYEAKKQGRSRLVAV